MPTYVSASVWLSENPIRNKVEQKELLVKGRPTRLTKTGRNSEVAKAQPKTGQERELDKGEGLLSGPRMPVHREPLEILVRQRAHQTIR